MEGAALVRQLLFCIEAFPGTPLTFVNFSHEYMLIFITHLHLKCAVYLLQRQTKNLTVDYRKLISEQRVCTRHCVGSFRDIRFANSRPQYNDAFIAAIAYDQGQVHVRPHTSTQWQ